MATRAVDQIRTPSAGKTHNTTKAKATQEARHTGQTPQDTQQTQNRKTKTAGTDAYVERDFLWGESTARESAGAGVGKESTTEPLEEKVDGTGEARGTGVEVEAEKDWEEKRT